MLVKYIGKSDRLGCINGKIYEIMGEEKSSYRIVDETGEDYQYQKKNFIIADSQDLDEPIAMHG